MLIINGLQQIIDTIVVSSIAGVGSNGMKAKNGAPAQRLMLYTCEILSNKKHCQYLHLVVNFNAGTCVHCAWTITSQPHLGSCQGEEFHIVNSQNPNCWEMNVVNIVEALCDGKMSGAREADVSVSYIDSHAIGGIIGIADEGLGKLTMVNKVGFLFGLDVPGMHII